jgi:hypothetical protein
MVGVAVVVRFETFYDALERRFWLAGLDVVLPEREPARGGF